MSAPSSSPTVLAVVLTLSLVGVALPRSAHASEPGSRPDRPGTRAQCGALEAEAARQAEPEVRLELAECLVHAGLIASGWEQARLAADAARAAGYGALEASARARAKALEPELSYLTVTTWKGQQVLVTQDGAPLADAVLDTAVPVDPGRHVITATAPGKRSWTTRVDVSGRGDHVAVSVPVLPDDAQLQRELPGPPLSAAPADSEPRTGSVQRTLGIVAGAVGIAGVAAGTLFGLKAASDWSDAKSLCTRYPYCGEEGARLAREAKQSALISTIGFATGVAGLTGGVVLWFTAEKPERKQNPTSVGVGLGRVLLRGSL